MSAAATRTGPVGYAHREVTHPPDWHGLVVWDVFLNAATTGLFLVAAAAELARPTLFAPITSWAYPVALAVLVADLLCLVLDLGDPLRFHHMLRVFKPSSPMSLGTWCLTAYSLPLTAVAALSVSGELGLVPADASWVGWVRTALLVAGLPFAFGSAAYKGVLFSTTAQPGWRDARWLGAYHIGTAFALGCGGLLLLAAIVGRWDAVLVLRPALAALVVVTVPPLVLLARELGPTLRRVGGGWAVPAGSLAVGAVVPLVTLAVGGEWTLLAVGGVAVGAYLMRSLVVRLPHAVENHHPSAG